MVEIHTATFMDPLNNTTSMIEHITASARAVDNSRV